MDLHPTAVSWRSSCRTRASTSATSPRSRESPERRCGARRDSISHSRRLRSAPAHGAATTATEQPSIPEHAASENAEQLPGAEPVQADPSAHPEPHVAGEQAAGVPPQEPLPDDQVQPVWMAQLTSSPNPAHGAGVPVHVRAEVQKGAPAHGVCAAQPSGTPLQTSICSQFVPTYGETQVHVAVLPEVEHTPP